MSDQNNTVIFSNITSYLTKSKYGGVFYVNMDSRITVYDIKAERITGTTTAAFLFANSNNSIQILGNSTCLLSYQQKTGIQLD